MEGALKKKLLQRKFASIEYIEEMQRYFREALDALEDAISWVEQRIPASERDTWHRSDWPETWRSRAQRNLHAIDQSITQGLREYVSGDPDRIVGTCNNIMSLGKDMDNMGWRWWDHVPDEYRQRFIKHRRAAMDRASNIWETVGDYWDDSDDLLDEEVTGPVDEQDLLRYLQPGESP